MTFPHTGEPRYSSHVRRFFLCTVLARWLDRRRLNNQCSPPALQSGDAILEKARG
jgi:hypothetical protein